MIHPRHVMATVGLTLIASLGVVSAAFGQNALDAGGNGDALDASLGRGPGQDSRRNSTRIEENFRNRNLIITGNVAGGRGFRGSVGYSAEGDFRGRLGSNDLYQFRADSAFSDPQLFRLGTTYEQLRFGQNLGLLEYRRSGAAAAAPTHQTTAAAAVRSTAGGFRADQVADARLKADRLSEASTSRAAQQGAAEPRVVGMVIDEKGAPIIMDASPLRGVSVQPMNTYLQSIGLTSLDTARLRDDKIAERGDRSRLGMPFETRFESIKPVNQRSETTEDASRVERPLPGDFQTVLERIAERYVGLQGGDVNADPKVLKALDEKFQELRDRLGEHSKRGDRDAARDDGKGRGKPVLEGERPLRGPKRSDADRPGVKEDQPVKEGEDQKPGEGTAKPAESKSAADFGVILKHGQKVERFSTDAKDRFNEIMRDAEQMLKNGEYFDAERRFEHASRFTPDHPLAAAGIGHAQIGAGLYLSASLTLQRLFTHTPEMIDVAYGANLLPTRDVLIKAADLMRSRLSEETDRRSNGFLLAYIGRQLGDPAMINEGINAMLQSDPEDELAKLMKQVWE